MDRWGRFIIENRVAFVVVFGLAAIGLACVVSNVVAVISNWLRWCGNSPDCNNLDLWAHVARVMGILP